MNKNKNILGVKGISGNLSAGVGYVIIPENIDIEEYKQDVYSSGRISIYGGYSHSNFYNILIDRETLQRIKFPKKSGEMGSPVVWINIPKHNEPIVIACIKYDEDYFSLGENRRRDTLTDGENIVDFDLDAKNGRISISGNGVDKPMIFDIELSNPDAEAIFKIKVNGKILAKASKEIIYASSERIEHVVTDKNGVVKGKIRLSPLKSERYRYEDEFENKVIISEEKVEIRADKSKKINLGDGKEQLVLGNKLLSILEEFDDALAAMTVPTAFGPSGTRINQIQFTKVRNKFKDFLSNLSNTD